jgi:NAD(P)-dependent dehydrogenase (short-subunit alcohol dehydrogenase family)
MQQGKLAGKVALVTGAASGIGRATALLFSQEGARVAVTDRCLSGAQRTAELCPSSQAYPLDITLESDWEKVMQQVARDLGSLDIVVNCAGISAASPLVDTDRSEWRRVMEVNLDGVFLGTKHALQNMRRSGGKGSIVNVASASGIKARPGAAAYCCSKAAVLMLTRTAALECLQAGEAIRVNSVSPGAVKTPLWGTMPFFQELVRSRGGEEAAFAAMLQDSPQERWAEPGEIASGILYLASDDALFVTGTNLVLDGGDTA